MRRRQVHLFSIHSLSGPFFSFNAFFFYLFDHPAKVRVKEGGYSEYKEGGYFFSTFLRFLLLFAKNLVDQQKIIFLRFFLVFSSFSSFDHLQIKINPEKKEEKVLKKKAKTWKKENLLSLKFFFLPRVDSFGLSPMHKK